jgi:uncharacterized protein (DUF983 family)
MDTEKTNGYLVNTLKLQCPRCRKGKLFQNKISINTTKNVAMHKQCLVCGQPTEIEVGFYVGTGYVSYAFTVALSVATFVAWVLLIGISSEDNRIFWWLGCNALLLILLQPFIMRLCRSIWISWFVKYDSNWKQNKVAATERTIASQMEGNQDINKSIIE